MDLTHQVSDLLTSLTIEERALLVTGQGSWHTKDFHGKIPQVTMSDGPHGLRKQDEEEYADLNKSNPATCFPTGSALASGWNTDAIREVAVAIAEEAKAERVSVVLGPAINIKRSPLCGRNFEYYSEDPYLAGRLGTAYIQAMQAEGVGTSLKHFACNSQETMRQTSNSEIDERAYHEIYLRAFEMCVKEAKPATIMASYNRINGTYACANEELLTDILRNRWGYDGAVISDWGATIDIVKCIKAGLDLEMPDSYGFHTKHIMNALDRRRDSRSPKPDAERGSLSLPELNRAVTNVLRLACKYPTPAEAIPCDYHKHHELARRIASESAVLLKHTGAFPLQTTQKILLVGTMATKLRFQGGGSSHITTLPCKNIVEALTDLGYDLHYSEHATADALSYDRVIYFGGLTDIIEGEGYDRENLDFPADQLEEIHALTAANPHTSVVTFGGAPMLLPFYDEVEDILHMHLGGQAVGEACALLLAGKVNPCGKLAETWPRALSDVPCRNYYARRSNHVPYVESIYVGYRYYESFGIPVLFPFGYGLSYTSFSYSDLAVTNEEERIRVSYTVTNTGSVAGAEISQIYVQNPEESTTGRIRPAKELAGFSKDYLEPGESKRVEVILNDRACTVYDAATKSFVTLTGDYTICVGASIQDIRLQECIHVDGASYEIMHTDDDLTDTAQRNNIRIRLTEYGPVFNTKTWSRIYEHDVPHLDHRHRGEFTVYDSMEAVCRKSVFGRVLLRTITTVLPIALHGGKDDPATKLVLAAFKEAPLDGMIGVSGGIIKPNLTECLVLHANGKPLSGWGRLLRGNRKSDRVVHSNKGHKVTSSMMQ